MHLIFKKKRINSSTSLIKLIADKKIPILTLDKNWHDLFSTERKTKKIVLLESELNALLKNQGKWNNEAKEYQKLKKKMINEIMELSTEAFASDENQAKNDIYKNKNYIQEINNHLQEIEGRLNSLPQEIDQVNKALLIESIVSSYTQMAKDKREIKELDNWIQRTRELLKEKIIEKQEKETYVDQVYSYLHNMIGVEMIEKIDENFGE